MKNIPLEKTLPAPISPLVDSHIHLDSEAYDEDWRQVWRRAQGQGLKALVLPAVNLASSRRIVSMCGEEANLFAAVGFHPHQAQEFDPAHSPHDLEPLVACAQAVGETGLEAHYDFCPWEAQLVSLRFHLQLARESGLPLILHCRQAEAALYQELVEHGPYSGGGVVHCYTGDWEMAQRFLDLGFHLGVNGIVTLANATQVHQVARLAPLERLLLETDGPYLAPKPFRGYRNEPALVPLIARQLAELRGEPLERVAQATSRNSKHLFRLQLEV